MGESDISQSKDDGKGGIRMKYSCNVIKDLIPLYYDSACSQESKEIVEQHIEECQECRKYLEDLKESNDVEKVYFNKELELQKAKSFKNFSKKMLYKSIQVVATVMMVLFIIAMMLILVLVYDQKNNKNLYSDSSIYKDTRNELFTDRMKEIWPESISSNSSIDGYKIVTYYDDATAYTGYMSIEYKEEDYSREVNRLKEIESVDSYNITDNSGIDGWDVLAIKSFSPEANNGDQLNGLTYALTDGNNQIIFVELEFPRSSPREDYKKIIPSEYLPDDISWGAKTKTPIVDRLIWGGGPIVAAAIFIWRGIINISKKMKRGYLQCAFSLMLIIFGILNLTV